MRERINSLMQRLPEEVDCALITSDVNRRYFTGMLSSAGTLLCFRDAAYFIIDFRYIEKARKTVKDCTVIQQDNLYAQLRKILQEHQAGCMAVESMTLTLSQFAAFREKLGDLVLLDDSSTLSKAIYECRMVKSTAEIEKILFAQRIAEAALEHVLSWIHPGVTERDIQMELDFNMIRMGAEELSFPTIALTGAATSMPHGVPSAERTVQRGDFVLMDFGATVDGYHSDMTRTVCVGSPTDEMREVYDIVLTAQKKALASLKEGITGQALDAIAREHIAKAGYGEYFGHSLGHGVGMEIHEYPNAGPGSSMMLRAGNIITIEPGIYLPEKFGVRIEDFAAVTEEGCVNLTLAPKELIIL